MDVTPILFILNRQGGIATIRLSCPTEGATIHYTINGSTPTSNSEVYSAPFQLVETTTIKAIACKTGLLDSDVASITIEIWLPSIQLEIQDGDNIDNCKVVVSNLSEFETFENVRFHYTTNGQEPTEDSPYSTTGIINVEANSTVKVKAFFEEGNPSETATIIVSDLQVQTPDIEGE